MFNENEEMAMILRDELPASEDPDGQEESAREGEHGEHQQEEEA